MDEPPFNNPAMFDKGYYFVRYSDGEMTFMMSRASAAAYARIFKGTVHRHSKAPKNIYHRLMDALKGIN